MTEPLSEEIGDEKNSPPRLGGVARSAGVVDLTPTIDLINHPSHDLRSCCPPNLGGQSALFPIVPISHVALR